MKYDAFRLWCRHEMRTNLIALYRSLSYCQWGDTNRSDPLPVRPSGYFQALSNSWTRDDPEQIRGVARTGIISGLRGFHVHLKPHSCSPYLAWSWRIVKTNPVLIFHQAKKSKWLLVHWGMLQGWTIVECSSYRVSLQSFDQFCNTNASKGNSEARTCGMKWWLLLKYRK